MDHICEYETEFRVIERKYDSTSTFVIETTSVSVQVCFVCGKTKQRTPTVGFVSIRTNYDAHLILGHEIMEEGDVRMERPVTCDWMDYVPRDEKDFLCIRISEIKKANCKCKPCSFLKTYVDFVEDQYYDAKF